MRPPKLEDKNRLAEAPSKGVVQPVLGHPHWSVLRWPSLSACEVTTEVNGFWHDDLLWLHENLSITHFGWLK